MLLSAGRDEPANDLFRVYKLVRKYLGLFLGSVGVPWGHGWVTHPWRLRMGWVEAENNFFADFEDVKLCSPCNNRSIFIGTTWLRSNCTFSKFAHNWVGKVD